MLSKHSDRGVQIGPTQSSTNPISLQPNPLLPILLITYHLHNSPLPRQQPKTPNCNPSNRTNNRQTEERQTLPASSPFQPYRIQSRHRWASYQHSCRLNDGNRGV